MLYIPFPLKSFNFLRYERRCVITDNSVRNSLSAKRFFQYFYYSLWSGWVSQLINSYKLLRNLSLASTLFDLDLHHSFSGIGMFWWFQTQLSALTTAFHKLPCTSSHSGPSYHFRFIIFLAFLIWFNFQIFLTYINRFFTDLKLWCNFKIHISDY